jgi:dynein heavy chain, axonemal
MELQTIQIKYIIIITTTTPHTANISCALTETSELLDTMQSLQPQTGSGAGKSWDELLLELAADIATKIPDKYDIEMALLDFPVRYDECMNTVLVQELIRFNRVIGVTSQSLKEVQRAVKGLVVMSGELEAMGKSMVIGKVPAMWGAVSYPSLKALGGWVKDFLDRLDFLRKWFEAKKAPPLYWISGFFFTQAFITGTLQNFARKFQIPIDQTDFDFKVLTPSEEEKARVNIASDGAYVHGLFMEGGRWNVVEHYIDESLPRELFISMAYFHLWPRVRRKKKYADFFFFLTFYVFICVAFRRQQKTFYPCSEMSSDCVWRILCDSL